MIQEQKRTTNRSEIEVEGHLVADGVRISEKKGVDELSARGYGVSEDSELLLAFYEALYLLDKGIVIIKNGKKKSVDFQELLQRYESVNENAWAKYLTYRDLKSRGYVVRGGFGLGVDFRVYERGQYGKSTAKHLVLGMQEGKPLPLQDLTYVLRQCQSLKKTLVLAVMNRRGEIVYYTVSRFTLKS